MVVVSGTWAKNALHYSSQMSEDSITDDNEIMAAKAILICRPNSHHFEERTLILDQPIKVGRSVARAKATATNAIFDCKVLSRHHALLWYENGKFYLQDTKSSNGTFVNNNRLSTENHVVSSGDIVQFGVDVVENNRKITHGCIIATVKLYLPDGKEAKASSSISEGDPHGSVPLDDLYKLNQILQEANQREQCLESKLNALQNVVEKTKNSAEESWQAYVEEERLLSRISALETQLQQARNNWSDDKLKEELVKLRENNERYQEAAKEALEKVHTEKQEAVVLALEQERAKISAEQDALLAREQLIESQLEIQEIAQKLREMQTKFDEEKQEQENQVKELEQQLQEEEYKIKDLENQVATLSLELVAYTHPLEKRPNLILDNDLKLKEDIIAENEIMSELNKSNLNGFDQKHISLTVAPVEVKCEEKSEDLECESMAKDDDEMSEVKIKEEGKHVSFNLPEDGDSNQENSPNGSPKSERLEQETKMSNYDGDNIDSKTLKYQYQSAQKEQNELRRKIDILEKNSIVNKDKLIELNKALTDEKELSGERLAVCEQLREQLATLEQKWNESSTENQKLIERVNDLMKELEKTKQEIQKTADNKLKNEQIAGTIGSCQQKESTIIESDSVQIRTEFEDTNKDQTDGSNYSSTSERNQSLSILNTSVLSTEQLTNIEEELVLFKEKYAQSCEDKVKLQRDLLKLKVQYDSVCDSMYNKYFWYVGPLIIIVIYFLIREWIS